MKSCIACNEQLENDAKFCGNCGEGQKETIVVSKNMLLDSDVENQTYTLSLDYSESEPLTLTQIKSRIKGGKLTREYWVILNNTPNAQWKPIRDILDSELMDIQSLLNILDAKKEVLEDEKMPLNKSNIEMRCIIDCKNCKLGVSIDDKGYFWCKLNKTSVRYPRQN
jgi:hypothetical protein